MTTPTTFQVISLVVFLGAIVHTFFVSKIAHYAERFPEGSIRENLFHFLAEIEAVFGIWSLIYFLTMIVDRGTQASIHYLNHLNFTEPLFVFVIMAISATKPVIQLSEMIILKMAKLIPLDEKMAIYIATMILGPLLGSLITEPAAMTVTAYILLQFYFSQQMSPAFRYASIGLLFVNISIGGTLTHFAAPPVVMVASKWNWGLETMFFHFGYKGAIACLINSLIVAYMFKKELSGKLGEHLTQKQFISIPNWMFVFHLLFLALTIYTAHYPVLFIAIFLFFLGFVTVTKEYQSELKIKESLMVGFFLAGLIVIGNPQSWWLQPIIEKLSNVTLFLGSTLLTAITDNAALTYLGSLVNLSDDAKYYLLAGAVSGGGLTIIANAPNPVGYGILKSTFEDQTLSPWEIFKGSLIPTLIALICFYFLPH